VQVALGHNAKRTDRRQHAAPGDVDLVDAFALPNQFAFWTAREVPILRGQITRVMRFVTVAFTGGEACYEL
jgi:hypothetical protein